MFAGDRMSEAAYTQQFAGELIVVGLATIPMLALVKRIAPQGSDTLHAFLAGAGMHLLAEVGGLNLYYVKHSAAGLLYNMRTSGLTILPPIIKWKRPTSLPPSSLYRSSSGSGRYLTVR